MVVGSFVLKYTHKENTLKIGGLMISVNRQFEYGKVFNDARCLSTDEKPTENIRNGSILTEIDTGKRFAFDADGKRWIELPSEQGGGGGYTVDDALSDSSENPVQNKVVKGAIDLKAPIASPAFTGIPTVPTAEPGTNTQQIATTAFVRSEIESIDGVGTVYGFHVDSDESDPYECVRYIADAAGMKPACMDYANSKFDWGDWKNAFFLPRPCMLKPDGTVDFYLDPSDHSKRVDGTASHIAHLGSVEDGATSSAAYAIDDYVVRGSKLYVVTSAIAIGDAFDEGTNVSEVEGAPNVLDNAMMEWGRDGKAIWYKVVPDSDDATSCDVYIADHKADGGFKCWSFVNNDGNIVPHFYTPMYFGTIVGGRLRSLSGQSGSVRCKSKTATAEREFAKANNPSGIDIWDIETWCDTILIQLLLVLMSKSLNSQTAFGEGLHSSGSDATNDGFTSGQHDSKGLFWGTSSGTATTYTNAVKVFGMENWWGFTWRRLVGLAATERVLKYKLTKGTSDGSTSSGYVTSDSSDSYSGYLSGKTMPVASGAYIKKSTWEPDGSYTPTIASGTSTMGYCDGLWTNTGTSIAYRGGASIHGTLVGAFYLSLYYSSSYANWLVGAAPSCKPQS